MTPPTPPVLGYLGRADRPAPLDSCWRSQWFRLAVGCWAVPLGGGVAILAGYGTCRAIGWEAAADCLAAAGGVDLVLAPLGVLLGGAHLVIFVATRWRSSGDRWGEAIGPAAFAALLLASNRLVAFAYFVVMTASDY